MNDAGTRSIKSVQEIRNASQASRLHATIKPPLSACICLTLCLVTALLAYPARGDETVASQFGLCFGGGGTIEAPSPKLPADAKGLCVEFRFEAFSPITQTMRAVSQWTDDPKMGDACAFHFDLVSTNRIAFTFRIGKGRFVTVTSKDPWDIGRWHHAAATWNGADLALYVDGKPAGGRRIDGFKFATSTLPLTIGQPPARRGQEPPALKGFISDVAVWAAAPAAAAIAEGSAKSIVDDQPGLAAHLALREAGPAELTKETVSGQDAKLSAGLARTGWCLATMWDQPAPQRPHLHLFSYDLSTPASGAAGSEGSEATPALVKPSRMILLQNAKSQQFGVLWQDKTTNGIYLTWINADFSGQQTVRLKSMEDGILAAGCADPTGNLCYLEIQKTPAGRDANTPLKAFVRGASADGKPLGEVPIDVTKEGKGFNVWNYGGRWVGSMTYQNGSIALVLPRTMYQSPDGLNHQGAIAVVFPENDPASYKNFGQITGHEFGNILNVNSQGQFIALDLGDCYPRGVHLHKFTATEKTSRVVFTFKTEHSTSPRNGSPKYDEISSAGKTYYKWSNDNNTYTELGGAIEGRLSYSVIFSTDRSAEGRVLDNSRAFGGCNDPRDLAMVRIVKDFERTPGSNEVSDALLAGGPPEGSTSEVGGFFNFAGNWTRQRETGIIWLTHFKAGEAAHAPHPVRQHDGNELILWEKTGPDDAGLVATKVAEDGKILGEAAIPGSELHLNREEPVIASGGRDFLLATDKSSGAAKLCFVYEDFPIVASANRSTSSKAAAGK